MALNRSKAIRQAHTLSDTIAAVVTNIAGSMTFLVLNLVWFILWLLANNGVFGEQLIIDAFPYSFLTTAVSLEAIILSSFVLMAQRRQSRITELRTELDYRADVQSEIDIKTMVTILERIASAQKIDITDLIRDMKTAERRATQASDTLAS